MATKLEKADVTNIRMFVEEGGARREMAEVYGVSLETVNRIVRGDSHRDVRVNVMTQEKAAKSSQVLGDRLLARLKADGLAGPVREESPEERQARCLRELGELE